MVALGVILHAVGGMAAGSFYAPCKKIKSWAWENYWLTLGLFAWIIVPLIMAAIFVPQFFDVLKASPRDALGLAFLFGVLWGIGSITFGLSIRYLGMSLGFAISLGFCAAFGTLIPPLFNGLLGSIVQTASGRVTLSGIALCLVGIAVCGKAGSEKEKALSAGSAPAGEFNLPKGVLVAVFAGVMSSCMSFAFKAGAPAQQVAVNMGVLQVRSNIPLLVIILWGGFLTNALWCIFLSWRNRTFRNFCDRKAPRLINLLLCAAAGTLWYFQFFFYGMGETQMGHYNFVSWSLHMAFIIVTSNVVGLLTGEWKGCHGHHAVTWLYSGTVILILATLIIGLGSSMAVH